jgi:hypothetical protein
VLIALFRYLYSIEKSPKLFRTVSVAAHTVVTFLIYLISISSIFINFTKWEKRILALGAAMLFASHPVHVESVTAVVNLAEPFSTIFVIFSYLLFMNSIHIVSSKDKKLSNVYIALHLMISSILWCMSVIMAVLFKETGIIATLFIIAYLFGRKLFLSTCIIPFSVMFYWIFISSVFIYVYFGLRSILVNPARMEILQDPLQIMSFILTYLFQAKGDSYLNTSQLLRRAENPFAFLTGQTKILSMLVSLYVSIATIFFYI